MSIIKAFLNRKAFLTYKDRIETKDLTEEVRPLFSVLLNYHSVQTETQQLSVADLANLLFASTNKDKDFYVGILEELEKLEVQEETTDELIKSIITNKALKELSLVAYDVTEGRETVEHIKSLAEKFVASMDVAAVEEDFAFISDDLQSLAEKRHLKPGLRWRLNTLNRMLGSLRLGDFGFIFARPESFSRDTEVLTPQGWLTVDKVTTNTLIAQVSAERKTEFIEPLAVHPHEQTECYHIHDTLGRVDLVVTKGHGMVIENQKGLVKERADTVKYNQFVKHHVAASSNNKSSVEFNNLTKLQIAYQADGRTRGYTTHGYAEHSFGYEISVLKERKVNRLKDIVNGIEHNVWVDKRGHTGFYIKTNNELFKDFDWVDLNKVDQAWCQQFIEELSYWDATRRTNTRFKFDTTNKKVADKVQAIAVLAGYNCLLSEFVDDRKDTYNNIFSLSIRTQYKPVNGQCIKKDLISFTDTTYCFEVPSGMLLVRRNGAVAVCGNTGKTTFLASETTYMAEQLSADDGPVIWLNNEEQCDKVKLRTYQAALGVTKEALLSNIPANQAEYQKLTSGKHMVVDSTKVYLSKKNIEAICAKHKPSLLVIDQIDKIHGFDNDREDLRLGDIYIWARELAKKYCPVIGVCQADGTAEGVKWLNMNHVANAKTSKQAEADWILGIGKINEPGYETLRFLHASKNKLDGDADTEQALRHGKQEVLIEPTIARYRDL